MKLSDIQQKSINLLMSKIQVGDKIQLYKDNGAPSFIIDILIKQKQIGNPKVFGVMMENVAQEILGLHDSINSEHDKTYNGKKIEIKTSTKGKSPFQYNSIRLDYDYDYLLLQNINFNSINYYIISKSKILELSKTLWHQKQKKKNIIQMICFKDIKDYVLEINNISDLEKLI